MRAGGIDTNGAESGHYSMRVETDKKRGERQRRADAEAEGKRQTDAGDGPQQRARSTGEEDTNAEGSSSF